MPSSLLLNSELFSCYKNHTTVKALLGISPKGFSTFIGQLYSSSISDREMVEQSGILNLPGDSVMADKALPLWISFLLESLKFPPFLGMSDQMSAEDVVATQEIASLRIHIEKAINKVKNFKIFHGVIPLIQLEVLNQMWCVCYVMQFTRYYQQCLMFIFSKKHCTYAVQEIPHLTADRPHFSPRKMGTKLGVWPICRYKRFDTSIICKRSHGRTLYWHFNVGFQLLLTYNTYN